MSARRNVVQVAAISLLFAGAAHGQIVSGRFLNWAEDQPSIRRFGDGIHRVSAGWSVGSGVAPTSGWFYGGVISDSSVAYTPGCDVRDVGDASQLTFQDSGSIGTYPEHSLIVWRHRTTGYYGVMRVDRIGTETLAGVSNGPLDGTWYFQTNGSGDFAHALRRGDFDSDGRTDLILRHAASGRRMLWLLNGTTQGAAPLWLSPDPAAQARVAGVDDFDGDNHSDLVLQDEGSGAVEFWLLDGAARRGAALPLVGGAPRAPEWQIAATGDFDGDGRGDLVWHNTATQKIEVWALNGTSYRATLGFTPDQAVAPNWEIVAAQDYDGDGTRDLLWYNVTSGKTVQWLLDSQLQRKTGRFTYPSQAGDANWRVVASADLGTGPGGVGCTSDLVWRNGTSGNLVVWYLDRDGNRTFGTFTTPLGPLADPDGTPTVASAWTVESPR